MHQKNLQRFATVMYKVKSNIAPLAMQELFTEQINEHDLRNKRYWEIPKVGTVGYGTESIRYREPKTWELLPTEIKEAKSILEFKTKIKGWKPQGCTCRLCKICIHNLGFLH